MRGVEDKIIKNSDSYLRLSEDIEKNISPIAITGIISESLAYLVKALRSDFNRQVLILTRDESRLKAIKDELELMGEEIISYPKKDIIFYDIEALSKNYSYERINILRKLQKKDKFISIASINALYDKIDKREIFEKQIIDMKQEEEYEIEEIVERLVDLGYERVDMIEGKGQFALRGGILDVFPIEYNNPIRIEFFDNIVDSMRVFELDTQRSIENIQSIEIETTNEINITNEERIKISDNIEKSLNRIRKKSNDEERIKKLEEKFLKYSEKIKSNMHIRNIDILIPFIDKKFSNIIDYLDDDAIIILDDSLRLEENFKNYIYNFHEKIKDYIERAEVFPEHLGIVHEKEYIINGLERHQLILSSNLIRTGTEFKLKDRIGFETKATINYKGDINLFTEDMKYQIESDKKIVIFAENLEKGRNLAEDLINLGLDARFLDELENIDTGINIVPYSISKGFEIIDIKTVLISYSDIFGTKKKKKKSKFKNASRIDSFTDLKKGDFVVHENHGIGIYKGIEQLLVQGTKKDYLVIEYSGSDKLYIPIDQMNLVQKYIGSDVERVKINKLGSADWTRTKKRVKKAIEDMAEDLIKLYAKRTVVEGYKFSEDTPWQNQFEGEFPYEETDDQLKATEEIKRDMEKKKPMDRLLCGDVGFGKTEVALRAVFKAVMDGKQVAFLVPTTILSEQHYNTIVNRFKGFPINIACLSRFRTNKEQNDIINGLKEGNIDIVVGTHKLLSKRVKYKDLGLLIIDEEQRFGVKQKESIKELSERVDVLALSATPIPRTLHMSLSGIRDMSVLEEPPQERYPIQTYVLEFNENLIRDAVLKEISRGGQVYIVHNRVRTIDSFASEIKKIIPEAEVGVVHGQMSESQMENIMAKFIDEEINLLICTTIIETGMDISNVNTLIVMDADKMGLSQLYQLRGRVGRSNRIAFAYFMYEKNRILSEVSEKRLQTIREFTEFGSGFKIAMRDLEIRGAGNLLGSEQHGQMASIGYDLYIKFLDEAIKKLRGTKEIERVDTNIELNINGFIRSEFISDEEQKIIIYKKISAVESEQDIENLIDELIDIYGDIPKEVENLINISYIKNLAGKLGIINIRQIKNDIRFEYSDEKVMPQNVFDWLIRECGEKIHFDMKKSSSIIYSLESRKERDIIKELREFLENMYKNL
ncbi:MAG: transcription-repair coupling factor [Andreesenia angusta]|nr:transcription-repair coupling factor [Andreesenia angusta]